LLVALALGPSLIQAAEDPAPDQIAAKAVAAVGGEAKLLRLFRLKEEYTLGESKNKTPRTSILEPPHHWWIGAKERPVPEPGTLLAWCWTLGILADRESKLAALPAVEADGRRLVGIRATNPAAEADLYFDPETWLLARVDWKKDSYLFSDWKDADGAKYAARCVATRGGKPFVTTEILALERLTELPVGLARRDR
jgi:hypothetical protein